MVLAIDKGYGLDKFAYRPESGGDIKYGKILSVVAEAPADAEDVPVFEGKKYYVNEEALMEESSRIKNMIDYKEMEQFAPLSVWNVIQSEKLDPKKIEYLAIGLSLAQKEYVGSFTKRMSKFKVDGIEFDFKNRVFVIPQGIGAKYAIDHYFYEEGEKPNYAIIDIGQLTIDVVTVVRGKVKKENASGEAHEGVIKIINELKEHIAQNTPGNEILSVKEVQEALVNGGLYLYGDFIDLSEKIDELKKDYTKYLATSLVQKYKNVFKKFGKIYIVGGGAYYIDMETLSSDPHFPSKIVEIPKDAEYFNAIGNLLVTEKKLSELKG